MKLMAKPLLTIDKDLKEEMIITEDYVFNGLEVLYYIGVTKN